MSCLAANACSPARFNPLCADPVVAVSRWECAMLDWQLLLGQGETILVLSYLRNGVSV